MNPDERDTGCTNEGPRGRPHGAGRLTREYRSSLDQPPIARAGRNHAVGDPVPKLGFLVGGTTKLEVYPVVYWPDRIRIVPLNPTINGSAD